MQRDLARQKGPEDLVLVKRALRSGLPWPAEKSGPSALALGGPVAGRARAPGGRGAARPDRRATADAELGRGVV